MPLHVLLSLLRPVCFTPLLKFRCLTSLLLASLHLSLIQVHHPALPARSLYHELLTLTLILMFDLAFLAHAHRLSHPLSLSLLFHPASLVPPDGGIRFYREQRPRQPRTALHSTSEEFLIFEKNF